MSDISKIALNGVTYDIKDETARREKVTADGGDISNTKVSAFEASTASFPVPVAGEKPKTLWGKTKKFCEDFINFKSQIVTKAMILNQIINDAEKVASMAALYSVKQDLDSLNNNFVGPRYALYNRFIVSAGGELFHLAPGVYQVSVEDTTYLPERWGTLINFRSFEKYGGVIFLSSSGKLHHREYTLEDNTWHNDWNTTTTTADLNTKVNKADNHNIAIGYDSAKKALSVTLDGVYIGNCTIAK